YSHGMPFTTCISKRPLTPKDLLTKEETWINKTDMLRDFDDVAVSMPNVQLRDQLNNYLVQMMPVTPTPSERREVFLRMVGRYPEFIDYYIRYKEDNGDTAVSLSE